MDTAAIRQQLEARRDELLRRAQRIDSHRHREEPLPADAADQATELENLDVLFALDREGRQALRAVSAALARLDAGEYGSCVRCGSPIAEARLQALPTAETCMACAGTATPAP